MRQGGHFQAVDRFERNVQGRVHADCDIGSEKIIIDRGRDSTTASRCAMSSPGLRAVATDRYQPLNPAFDQRLKRTGHSFVAAKFSAARAARRGAAQLQNAADVAWTGGTRSSAISPA